MRINPSQTAAEGAAVTAENWGRPEGGGADFLLYRPVEGFSTAIVSGRVWACAGRDRGWRHLASAGTEAVLAKPEGTDAKR